MPKLAFVSFLPDRWEAGVQQLSHVDEYIYFRVCKFIWGAGRSVKMAEIPAICRFHPLVDDSIKSLIAAGKLVQSGGEVSNERALEENRRATAISDGARRANAIRWQSERSPNGYPTPTPTPTPTKTQTITQTQNSETPESSSPVPARSKKSRAPARENGKEASKGSEAWASYASAYFARWGVAPTRSARANTAFANFVKIVPAGEAPEIAAWYVGNNRALYVTAKHPPTLLVRDAEGLRTEWLTGRQVTELDGRHTDRKQTAYGVFDRLIAEERAKNGQ